MIIILDAEDAYVVTQATKTQLEADKAAAQAALSPLTEQGITTSHDHQNDGKDEQKKYQF